MRCCSRGERVAVKRILIGIATAAAMGAVSASDAGAACSTVKCLDKQVSTLQSEVNRDTNELDVLGKCLADVPVTRYGDSAGSFGYEYDPGDGSATFSTTALDATNNTTDQVSAWLLADACNRATTAARDLGRARRATRSTVGPLGPELRWGPVIGK